MTKPAATGKAMKTKSNCSKQFNSRLAAYSATAGVALLAAPAAQATIYNITSFEYGSPPTFTTTPPDVTRNSTNTMNGVVFMGATAGHSRGMIGILSVGHRSDFGGAGGNVASIACISGIVATGYLGSTRAKDFSFGAPMMWAASKLESPALLAEKGHKVNGNPLSIGSFLPIGKSAVKTGYIGFGGSSYYYGWLRVKVVNDSSGSPFEVTLADKNGDGIYGAIGRKGDDLTAGETAGTSSVPDQASSVELGGLALLALGAFGVREQRRRRQPTGTH